MARKLLGHYDHEQSIVAWLDHTVMSNQLLHDSIILYRCQCHLPPLLLLLLIRTPRYGPRTPILLRLFEPSTFSGHPNFSSPPTPPAPPLLWVFNPTALSWPDDFVLLVFLLLLSPLALHCCLRRLLLLLRFWRSVTFQEECAGHHQSTF